MKKLLLILMLGMFTMVSMAQKVDSYESFVRDTITDAETLYLAIDTPAPISKDYRVAITILPVNLTGTATVTAMPQGSLDGVTYYDIESSAATVNNAGTVAEKTYFYANANYRYYRVELVSTGTGTTDFQGELGLKK